MNQTPHPEPYLPEWTAMYQSNEYDNGTAVSTCIDISNSVIVEHGWSVTGVNSSSTDSSKNILLFVGTVNQSLTSITGTSQLYKEQSLANFVNT